MDFILDLPYPVLDKLLTQYLDANSCLKLRLLSQKHNADLETLVFQKVLGKRLKTKSIQPTAPRRKIR